MTPIERPGDGLLDNLPMLTQVADEDAPDDLPTLTEVVTDETTGETTSHPTKQPEDGCQVVCYSHSTRLTKNVNQVAGYVFCLLSSVLCPLNAEELTDPTRPPLSITAPTVAGSAEMHPPAGLRSIIISKTPRAPLINSPTI